MCCTIVPSIWNLLGMGLVGIWIAMAVDEILRGLLFVYRWYSGKWKNRRLHRGIVLYLTRFPIYF